MPALITFLVFSFIVIQQPLGQPFFVSIEKDVITQYGRPNTDCMGGKTDNIVLLADEMQAGQAIYEIKQDDFIYITLDNRQVKVFRVDEILRYIAHDPYRVYQQAMFENEETGELINSLNLGERLFCVKDNRLVIQTCYNNTAGRLFVIAFPVPVNHNKLMRIE